jgi:hypothetical protein
MGTLPGELMASGTTRRISDNQPVEWREAISAWASASRRVLERTARGYGGYLTYQELAELVQQDSGITTRVPFRHWIGEVLGTVAGDRRSEDEPMLTSLVVHADGTIGDGYGIPVAQREGSVPPDLELHAAVERLKCYRYFGADIPPDGGSPMLTRQVAQRRANARRFAPPERRPVCPTCFLELPLSGQCDNCA